MGRGVGGDVCRATTNKRKLTGFPGGPGRPGAPGDPMIPCGEEEEEVIMHCEGYFEEDGGLNTQFVSEGWSVGVMGERGGGLPWLR